MTNDNEQHASLPLAWLSVFMADGDSLAVYDRPDVRADLTAAVSCNIGPVSLPLLIGVTAEVRASEIQGWAPNTPECRALKRIFYARCEAEDAAFEKENQAATQSETWR